MATPWTKQRIWTDLSPTQKAAAMALLEADMKDGRIDAEAARNALGAMINRSERTGEPLGDHVSRSIYQPTMEQSQFARLPRILQSQEFADMTSLAERRSKGEVQDWVQGATHFLAPEKTMVSLYQSDPDKYHNWGPFPNSRGVKGNNWTGYDPATGEYRGVVMRDSSHAFLSPDGAPSKEGAVAVQADVVPLPSTPPEPTKTAQTATPDQSGSDSFLTFASAYLNENDKKETPTIFNTFGPGKIYPTPGPSKEISGPRPPRIDIRSLLAAISGGVQLGTGTGPLGTKIRRA